MTMRGAHHVRPSLVYSTMDHECSGVQQPHIPTVDDLSLVIHLDEISFFDEGKRDAERIDPEGAWIDRIAKCNMPGDALVEAISTCAQDSISRIGRIPIWLDV